MGLVTKLLRQPLQIRANHLEVECTYDVVTEADGKKYLQLDTYGSRKREMPGKKSQSIRLSPEAIAQLKRILEEEGL